MFDSNPHRRRRFSVEEEGAPLRERWTRRIFLGPNGIRWPWRVIVAIALYKVFTFTLSTALLSNTTVYGWLRSAFLGGQVLTPGLLLFGEGIRTAAALLAGLAMAKLEDRTFSDYRVPGKEALGRRFWQGVPFGLGALALLISSIRLFEAVSIVNQRLDGWAAVRNGALRRPRSAAICRLPSRRNSVFGQARSFSPVRSGIARRMGLGTVLPVRSSQQRYRGMGARVNFFVSRSELADGWTGRPPAGLPVLLLLALAVHLVFPARRRGS